MALDKNNFDTWLKDKPWRDLGLRGLVWFALSGIAAFYALRHGMSPMVYFERVTGSLSPMVNAIGVASLLLSLPALAFKDLEAVAPDLWGQTTRRGRAGGVARRLAGDLILWTLGGFASLLSATVVAAILGGVKITDLKIIFGLLWFLIALSAGIIFVALLVRRAEPTVLTTMLKSPWSLLLAYGIFAAILVFQLVV